jgi:multiple sugar transport system substrate-binding protein
MKKKLFLVVALLSLCLILSSSIFGADKITVWIGGHVVSEESTWAKIIKDFEKKTGIEVEYQLIGFDVYYDRLVTAFQGGQSPDVCFADLGGWVPTFASKGWLEPIDKQVAAWDGTPQIWENLWPTVEYNKVKYGVPWYTDCRLLLYNKKMFRDAGLNPNKPPKTWAELLKYAQKLTNNKKRVYGYGVSGKKTEVSTLGYEMFLFANGGKLLTDDYKKAAFNNKAGLDALQFYTDLAKKHKVSPPNTTAYGEDEYRNMMAQNKVAMAIGGPWSFPLIETANPQIKGEYAVALHPYGSSPASVFGGWASVISKTSAKKDQSWKFIEYITSYNVWMEWIAKNGGPMPTRKDVCKNAPRFKEDPKWQVIFETFPKAGYRPPIPQYPEISNVIQNMIQEVILGQKTAKVALKEAEIQVNAILAK